MKKIHIFLILGILLFISSAGYAQENWWDYPIKPGTEEWKNFSSNKEMVAACQIPEYVLQNISSNDLMTLCLQYPLLFDVFAFNNVTDGMQKLFSDFNGIRAFSKRENAIKLLIEQFNLEFQDFPERLSKNSNLDIGYSIMRISMLELLLSYSELNANSKKEDQKKILETLVFGYQEKIKYSEFFKGRGFTTNLFARAHAIINIDETLSSIFKEKDEAVLFSGMADENLINTIDSLSYNLIK